MATTASESSAASAATKKKRNNTNANPKEKKDKGVDTANETIRYHIEEHSSFWAGGNVVSQPFDEFLNRGKSNEPGKLQRLLYNIDLEPFQHPLLKRFISIDPDNLVHREMLFESSPYLRVHSHDIVWELVKAGWKYVKKRIGQAVNEEKDIAKKDLSETINAAPPWPDELKTSLIRAFSAALVIGSAFITIEQDPYTRRYYFQVYTPNNVFRAFLNDYRRITEIYFTITPLNINSCKAKDPTTQNQFKLGYLTQFSELDSSVASTEVSAHNVTIHKKCVVLMPEFDMLQPYGRSVLYSEIITAISKLYIRFYEMLYLHKGGVDKNIVIPTARPDIKAALLRSFSRGVLNLGWIMEMEQDKELNSSNAVKFDNVQMPNLPFDIVNAHLNEDGILSQQGISGSSEANNLSGVASEVNDINDNNTIKLYQAYLVQIIKDINQTFYHVDPNSYDIVFNTLGSELSLDKNQNPNPNQNPNQNPNPNKKNITPDSNKQSDNSPMGNKASNTNILDNAQIESNAAYYDPLPQFFSLAESLYRFNYDDIAALERSNPDVVSKHTVRIECNSVNDDFVSFKGNMFVAGTYKYPERDSDQYITLTPADIKRYCERDPAGRTGYLDIDHGTGIYENRLKEGIGYFTTVSYDDKKFCDVTEFQIKRDVWEEWGKPQRIEVSPRFVRRSVPNGGNEIAIIDCTVVRSSIARSKLTGLDTSADIIKKT